MAESRFFIGVVVNEQDEPLQYLVPRHQREPWFTWLARRNLFGPSLEPPDYAKPIEGGTITFTNPHFE